MFIFTHASLLPLHGDTAISCFLACACPFRIEVIDTYSLTLTRHLFKIRPTGWDGRWGLPFICLFVTLGRKTHFFSKFRPLLRYARVVLKNTPSYPFVRFYRQAHYSLQCVVFCGRQAGFGVRTAPTLSASSLFDEKMVIARCL